MLPSSESHDEQHGLDAWREQLEEGRNRQGENRSLYGRPDRAYADFLEYMCFYYGESARDAERASAEG